MLHDDGKDTVFKCYKTGLSVVFCLELSVSATYFHSCVTLPEKNINTTTTNMSTQVTPPHGNGGSRESSEFEFVNIQNRTAGSAGVPPASNPLLLSSNQPVSGPGILTSPTSVKGTASLCVFKTYKTNHLQSILRLSESATQNETLSSLLFLHWLSSHQLPSFQP